MSGVALGALLRDTVYTYDDAGTFPFHCRPHFGMDGVVVVEP